MQLINEYVIKYANHLLGTDGVVLRGDRKRGDFTDLKIFCNEQLDLILQIDTGLTLEKMTSDPKKGAKERLDIHIDPQNLDEIMRDLKKFIDKNNLKIDSYASAIYDPTGTEHKDGLALGDVKYLTNIPVTGKIYYSELNKIALFSKIYIDAENYPDKQRYHLGARTSTSEGESEKSLIEFIISSEYACRFVNSIELAYILLNQNN